MGGCVSTGTVVGSSGPTSVLHTPAKSFNRSSSPESQPFANSSPSTVVTKGTKLGGGEAEICGTKSEVAGDIGTPSLHGRIWRKRSLSGDFFGIREHLTGGGPGGKAPSLPSPFPAGGRPQRRSASVGGGDSFPAANSGEGVRWRLPVPPGATGKESLQNPLVSLECFIFL